MKHANHLPNLRNLGIALRILVLVNLSLVSIALVLSKDLADLVQQLTRISAFAQPILMISLFLLYGSYPLLKKLNSLQGHAAIFALVLLSAAGIHGFFAQFWIFDELPPFNRVILSAASICMLTLYYLYLHRRAYSPAIAEARLQALQARIRPHFLFNSLNAVLSMIRSQPKQAETALEDLADLFRVLMADNRDLVPLSQEIALCRQYLTLEKLRIGERLNIDWQIEDMPGEALVPPLILQPLIENAVYHGIEPLAEGGTISIQIYQRQNELHLILKNPYHLQRSHHHGNKMALDNIKERLTLHFDLEATLTNRQVNEEYEVHITLPIQASGALS